MNPQPKPTEIADYSTRKNYGKNYAAANSEKIKNYQSDYAKNNRDAINQRKRAWRAARKAAMSVPRLGKLGATADQKETGQLKF